MHISPFILLALVSVALGGPLTSPSTPRKKSSKPSKKSTVPNAYILTLTEKAGTTTAQAQQDAFAAQAKQQGITYTTRHKFNTLINAITISATPDNLKRLQAINGVKGVSPVNYATKPHSIMMDIKESGYKYTHSITQVNQVHQKYNLTGKGIKVGIIDTGVDYTHPALGGCFGPGCKVAFGYDFIGDNYDASKEESVPAPDDDPIDHCQGHGTHVAGIIAASNDKKVFGVAQDATLGAYRICDCKGRTTTEFIIAALERAYKDGMDIINLSLGSSKPWNTDPSHDVVATLAEKGVVVVSAAGNDGSGGLYMLSSPGIAEKGLSIASYDNTRYLADGFKVDGTDEKIAYLGMQQNLSMEKVELVLFTLGQGVDCQAIQVDPGMKDKWVLVSKESDQICTQSPIIDALRIAKVAGVVWYNNVYGSYIPFILGSGIHVGITQQDGWKLLNLLKDGPRTISFLTEKIILDNPTGGRVSGFSSWGPSAEFELKPDFGAPGGLIDSTFPVALGSYTTQSGTSMSTPYVAGAIALYMQAKGKGKVTPQQIMDAFKLTAQPTTELNSVGLSPVFHQGSGMIQVKDALKLTTAVTPNRLSLKSSDFARGKLQSITITNTGKYPMRYILTHLPALAVSKPSSDRNAPPNDILHQSSLQVDISTKHFTLEAGKSTKVNIFFKSPVNGDISKGWLYSGYISIQSKSTSQSINKGNIDQVPAVHIPYGGMYGMYKRTPLFGPRPFDVRRDFVRVGGGDDEDDAQWKDFNWDTYSLKVKQERPNITLNLETPARVLRLSVLDANGKVLGSLIKGSNIEYTPRGKAAEVNWDGKYEISKDDVKTVPSGTYCIKAEALGPFGNKDAPQDWQSTISNEIIVDLTKPLHKAFEPTPTTPVETVVPAKDPAQEALDKSVLPQPIVFPR